MKIKIINRYTVSALAIAIIAVVTIIVFAAKHHAIEAVQLPKSAPTRVESQFTFNGASDWYQGPTRKGDMALFHKIKDSCFVSVQHITGSTIAAHQADKHKFDGTLASQGHTITQIGTQNMSIKTDTGIKQYELRQSNVTSPTGASADSGTLLDGGIESGYVSLSENDFIYVEGNCEKSTDLPTTLPALQAVTFNEKD